ncbi:venom metalloprotease inhibitor-like [Nomia melanderi]|uniref:venom metalloprotease inhibitor-like n=1 Tax=Nomia melanderi TaxID=2448451 RepID=UPI0013041866|nr:inducible metalloproteinase inhibitor protein-like [Nomia melanderi]
MTPAASVYIQPRTIVRDTMLLKIFVLCAVLPAVLSLSTFRMPLLCDGVNEEYQCGSACQTTCENLGEPCPIVNIRCNDGCYCKDGYARDCRGVCIDINQCSKHKCKRRPGRRWWN